MKRGLGESTGCHKDVSRKNLLGKEISLGICVERMVCAYCLTNPMQMKRQMKTRPSHHHTHIITIPSSCSLSSVNHEQCFISYLHLRIHIGHITALSLSIPPVHTPPRHTPSKPPRAQPPSCPTPSCPIILTLSPTDDRPTTTTTHS